MIKTDFVPSLPLRDIVVFPSMIVPLFVGRDKSIKALNEVMKNNKKIVLITQKNAEIDDPNEENLYSYGCESKILQLLKLPDGTVKVLVEGLDRVKIIECDNDKEFLKCSTEVVRDKIDSKEDLLLFSTALIRKLEKLTNISKKISSELLINLKEQKNPTKIADHISSQLNISIFEKQKLLETIELKKRLEKLMEHINNEINVIGVEKRIRGRVKNQMEKTQREYYLNEQMKAIQKELGEIEDGKDEIANLQKAIIKAKMTKEATKKCISELKKLKTMSSMSAEATVVRNYLDWMIELPWYTKKMDNINIGSAKKILDEDHYGLEKVKERILEYLAVQKRVGKIKGAILCLVGPPGVGKTSLGKSIARATGRKFVRMSLGGIRDEAEIRGHRRTYIGSLPGKIIQQMKKAGTKNPLFLLDEIDKVGTDYRGDPSSALLEALDPEQNVSFNDHYLEVDYDLSDVMFVTTANTLNILPPLLDRLEVIRIPGYTEDEKINIANNYLIPKQIKENGLRKKEIKFSDESICLLVESYTREAGVRNLERQLANVCRKAAREITGGKVKSIKVTPEKVFEYLGPIKFISEIAERTQQPGVVVGLAWTAFGGDILFIEATKMPGKGALKLTGKLGDVMKESVQAAYSYVRANAHKLGLDPTFYKKMDIHVHVPAGAIPKDGPSAGVAMITALVSLLTDKPVKDRLGMTGEISLRGNVLPIGGLKEKSTAAHRAGLTHILAPAQNEKDLVDIPKKVLKDLKISFVKDVSEVLKLALGLEGRKPQKPQKTQTVITAEA